MKRVQSKGIYSQKGQANEITVEEEVGKEFVGHSTQQMC